MLLQAGLPRKSPSPPVWTGPLAAFLLAARGVSPPASRLSRGTERSADGKLRLPARRAHRLEAARHTEAA